jgi:hypothetical protein
MMLMQRTFQSSRMEHPVATIATVIALSSALPPRNERSNFPSSHQAATRVATTIKPFMSVLLDIKQQHQGKTNQRRRQQQRHPQAKTEAKEIAAVKRQRCTKPSAQFGCFQETSTKANDSKEHCPSTKMSSRCESCPDSLYRRHQLSALDESSTAQIDKSKSEQRIKLSVSNCNFDIHSMKHTLCIQFTYLSFPFIFLLHSSPMRM